MRMIVDTMTDLELLYEVRKDYEEFSAYWFTLCHNPVYKKRMKWGRPKDGKFVIRINEWKSARGNLYNFVITMSGWNDFKKGKFETSTTTFFKRNKALNAIRLMFYQNDVPGIEIFTSHFIDRYNLRFLHQPYLSRKAALQLYLDNNHKTVITSFRSPKYDCNVMAAATEGYSLGKFENDILLHKTFVSRDMLYGNQFADADLLDEVFADSHDGPKSNIFTLVDDFSALLNKEKTVPTIAEFDQFFELASKYKAKLEDLEYEGKEFDLESQELQNQFLLMCAGIDWSKGQAKDEDGNLINFPMMKQLSMILGANNNLWGNQ
ncbi:hypothetical protein PRMUPPPA20_08630 [Xylanibacter ruminicola]|nr:hypothetical protein [Xylanibacter ruminicola]GJG32754.1 hypothetical protein PRMUPPPA20_08630 [Xylanibacter ruminicola]